MRKGRFLGAVLAGLMAGCAVPSGRAMGPPFKEETRATSGLFPRGA
jgi:hypothetical protein